ncbi:MAG: phycobiliprotein lyase [Cyanobacteriota bacterium]|nr:phycobiliprotein lyase [Cyanobacteriota bacterium]
MEIEEFFELSVGKWFSQRTYYDLASQQAGSGKSDIVIEQVSSQAPEVLQLCERGGVSPSSTRNGIKISWDNSADWGKAKQIGFALLVPIPDPSNPQIGQFLHSSSNPQEDCLNGCYALKADDALTLATQGETMYAEERLWFASPNLRLRTSFVKNGDRPQSSAFYSEIRRMPPANSDSPAAS